ncbi:ATP-binding protein [Oscillatoria acuminata]|uniref:ATP-dependent transcriptional regulator n=1 Tax=Oscillatoria acuminata PCC 6304 TaxID=56110 RepID=K9TQM9_9CYAN|nr:ATP-binding protein [Oscillatoria acuminata]AFY85167.1 ATP-dependent transcriptional regulator [Oscillatoria acuminata PCC 6304]
MIEFATAINILTALTALVIENAPAGAVSALSGKVVHTIWDRVKQQMQQGHEPVNLLQQAVYKVYLLATLEVCEAAYKQWGVASDRRRRSGGEWGKRPEKELIEIGWVDKVRQSIQDEIKQLTNLKQKPHSMAFDEAVELVLPPEGDYAQKNIEQVHSHLKQELLTQLYGVYGEPPASFVELLEKGWKKAGKQTDWFDCLYTFFIHEIQNNQGVANIFICEILKKLIFNDIPVISEKIDVLLKAIAEERGVLLQELRRRSLYEQYAGRDIAEKVENISKKYIQLFVGREGEFQCIDEFIQKNDKGVLLVTGGAGYGKSALLANWKEKRHEDGCFVAYHCFNYRDDDTRSIEKSYRNLLRQLYIYYELEEREIPDNLDGLQDMLLILKDRGTRENEPLIIVLDGLDEVKEINTSINAAIFSQLPQNAFILTSVRSPDGEKPAYLPSWVKNASTIQVKSLPREAIGSWIERFGSPRLSEIAQDTKFINTLYETTEGFPLHLEYLIKDLSEAVEQGNDVQEVLAKTPHGFKGYVEQQINSLNGLNELNLPKKRWLFFALLTVAKGVLREEDIKNVTGMRDRDLQKLKQCWQVTRWMHISEEGYAFAHPLLANLFAQHLKDDANEALQKLLEYCVKWPENQSFYVLRYYAKHLCETQQAQRLYELARDSAFATLQRERLPEDPDLPLETIREALLDAAQRDDPGAMAEFLLLQAKRVGEILQESPLDALRNGSLIRAQQLADLYDIHRCVLWYLLLAWALKDEGRLNEAEETLQKLQQKDFPRLLRVGDWQGSYAAYLLTCVFEVSTDICAALYPKLFENDYWKHLFVNHLINAGDFTRAIEVATQINSVLEQIVTLETIATAQKERKDLEEAKATLATALQVADKIFPDSRWVYSILEIAKLQIETGDERAKKDTLIKAQRKINRIQDIRNRTHVLVLMANLFSKIGEVKAALEILEKIEGKDKINDSSTSMLIAEVQLQCGETEKAKNAYARAKAIARNKEDLRECYAALVNIVQSQALMKDWDAAFETSEEIKIEQEWYYSEALYKIARKQLQEKGWNLEEKIHRAIPTIDKIKYEEWKIPVLQMLIESQAIANKFDDALKSAQSISRSVEQSSAFKAIAIQQAKAGKFEEAFNTIEYVERQYKQDSLIGIATAYAQGKQFEMAIQLALMLDSPLRQVETLGAIAKIQAQFSQNKDARDTLSRGLTISQSLDPSYLKAFAFIQIADQQVKSGNKKQRLIMVDSAYAAAQKITDLLQQIDVKIEIAGIYKQLGKSDKAKDILEKMRQSTDEIGLEQSYIRCNLFCKIAISQARIGEIGQSFETINKMDICDLQVEALTAISLIPFELTQKRIVKERLDAVLEKIDNLFLFNEVQVKTNIAVAKIALGETQTGLEIFAELCEQAQEYKNCSQILSSVAEAQAEAGEIDLALATVETIEDDFDIVKALKKIASFQWKKGDKDGIEKTLATALKAQERIQDKGKQLKAMWMISQIQVEAGKGEEAVETLNRIGKDRNHLISIIASFMAKVNDRKNFKQLLVPAALSLETAYRMCGYLAQLYPEQAASVAEQVERTEV